MKLENYEGTADTLTFPHNPQTFNDAYKKFIDQKDYPYSFSYFGTTSPLRSKRNLAITGHFDGVTKNDTYRELGRHCNSNKLKKLFFADDKFYIVIPQECKRTHSGGRTNFIDYVASFVSPFGIMFSNTQKSGNASSSEENEGNVSTPIEKITGTVTSGSLVTIETGDGDGFTFTPSVSGTVTIYLIKMNSMGNDNYFSEYLYTEINGDQQHLNIKNSDKTMFIKLDPTDSLNDIFSGGSVSGITSPTFYFRDGYSSD